MVVAMVLHGTSSAKAMEEGADIIIAAPGRLIALLQTGKIILDHLEHLILDEADRMLDMGFYDDLIKIINYLPKDRQTLLFSATMPPKIRQLANKILNQPAEVNIAIAKPAAGITQQAYVVHDSQKGLVLKHILKTVQWNSVIIFASTKETVKKLDVAFQEEIFLREHFTQISSKPNAKRSSAHLRTNRSTC